MKKIFTSMVVALILMAIPAQAQLGFGLRGGLNLTSVSLDESDLDQSNQEGFYVGPTIKFTIPVIGIGIDASALYDQRKSKLGDETIREENITIPINLRYTFGLGDLAGVFVKAGPQFGWNIGGKNYTMNSAKETFQLKKSNLSLNIGAGAMLMNKLELLINYNIALGKTAEYEFTNAAGDLITGNSRSNAWQLGLAYYF